MPPATRQVRHIELGDHLCLPFTTDDEQGAVIAPFIADGLRNGEKVLYLTDGTSPHTIDGWLSGRGVPSSAAWSRGQLEMRHATDLYLTGGMFDPDATIAAFATEAARLPASGYTGLRVTAEMSWALGTIPRLNLLMRYERSVQRLFGGGTIAATCQYDLRQFHRADVTRLMSCHTLAAEANPVYDDHQLRIAMTFRPHGLVLVGAVDLTTHAALAGALARATHTRSDVCLDLAGLEFIDVAGVRLIVHTALKLGGRRQVLLRQASPQLHKILHIAGWDSVPGLVLAEEVVS